MTYCSTKDYLNSLPATLQLLMAFTMSDPGSSLLLPQALETLPLQCCISFLVLLLGLASSKSRPLEPRYLGKHTVFLT